MKTYQEAVMKDVSASRIDGILSAIVVLVTVGAVTCAALGDVVASLVA